MSNKQRWVIGSLCVVYVAARLWRLGDSCLWFDEIFSVHAAEHDWPGMLRFVSLDLVHPPLFYALLKGWITLGGESVYWLRMFPVLFSVLALVPFLYLCRELKLGPSVTSLALLLIAVNGSLIKYTQTLRMYSLLMFLSLMSLWLFSRYFNRGKSWIWLVIVNILLVYTQYFGWMIVGAEVLVILLFQRIKIARTAAMAGIVFASFVPWLIAVWTASREGSDLGQNIAWQPRPGPWEVLEFLLDLVEPFYFQVSNTEPASVYLIAVPLLMICLAVIGYVAATVHSDNESGAVKLLTVFAAFPILTAFVLSWLVPYSVWGTRHLIVVTPIVSLVIAWAFSLLPRKRVRWTVFGLTALLIVAGLLGEVRKDRPEYVWCAWEGVANEIARHEEQSKIYALENLTAYHLWFALRRSNGARIGLIKGLEVRTADETYFLPRGFDSVTTAQLAQIPESEFWLAFRTFRNGEEFRTIETFTKLGYLACPPNQLRFEKNRVFWIKFTKEPDGCSISQ